MKVFISWSGPRSREVAFALREWLPNVLHVVDPFVSSKDIRAGARWQAEIAGELDDTSFGLICVTRENQKEPWLNFEAGALAKSVDSSRVIPLALDLNPADIANPLGQFQAMRLTRDDLTEVLVSINEFCDPQISDGRLQSAIEKWWPDLQDELEDLERSRQTDARPAPVRPERSDRDLLEELLTSVRDLSRHSDRPFIPRSPGLNEITERLKPVLAHHNALPWSLSKRGSRGIELTLTEAPSPELELEIARAVSDLGVAAIHYGVEDESYWEEFDEHG